MTQLLSVFIRLGRVARVSLFEVSTFALDASHPARGGLFVMKTSSSWARMRGASMGDALSSLPGVSATGFGPTASRSVIRGLDGGRIRLLDND
jgi:hypothetical protein